MCGKFRAFGPWSNVHSFSQPLTDSGDGAEDRIYRTANMLPVIIFDPAVSERRVVPMRWGYPNPKGAPVFHARSETVDSKPLFRDSFAEGKRGIVAFRTFNEGEEIARAGRKPLTQQWIVDPKDGQPRGFAFLYRDFGIPVQPDLCCVMFTVPANDIIRRKIAHNQDDPRMPAILRDENDAEDWTIWLGEARADSETVKSVLRTMEGVNWEATPEPRTSKPKRPREPDLF